MRFWISVPLVWALTYATGGRVTKEVLRRTALAGALFGINLAFVFSALHHSSVAVLAVIQTLQPGIVLLVAGRWLGERATGWHIGWTAVGVLGVVVAILGGDPEVRGDAARRACSAWRRCSRSPATTCSTGGPARRRRSARWSGWPASRCSPASSSRRSRWRRRSVDDYRQVAGADWLYLLFVAVIVGIVGHTMMSWAHRFIPAARSSLYPAGHERRRHRRGVADPRRAGDAGPGRRRRRRAASPSRPC